VNDTGVLSADWSDRLAWSQRSHQRQRVRQDRNAGIVERQNLRARGASECQRRSKAEKKFPPHPIASMVAVPLPPELTHGRPLRVHATSGLWQQSAIAVVPLTSIFKRASAWIVSEAGWRGAPCIAAHARHRLQRIGPAVETAPRVRCVGSFTKSSGFAATLTASAKLRCSSHLVAFLFFAP